MCIRAALQTARLNPHLVECTGVQVGFCECCISPKRSNLRSGHRLQLFHWPLGGESLPQRAVLTENFRCQRYCRLNGSIPSLVHRLRLLVFQFEPRYFRVYRQAAVREIGGPDQTTNMAIRSSDDIELRVKRRAGNEAANRQAGGPRNKDCNLVLASRAQVRRDRSDRN